MDGTKHQSLFQPKEESGLSTRALPSHDFCDARLYVTPSAYRFMSHQVKEVDGKLHNYFNILLQGTLGVLHTCKSALCSEYKRL